MSPRRQIDTADREYFTATPKRRLRWGLPLVTTLAVLVVAAALAASIFMVVGHESYRRTQVRDVEAIDYVRGFMTTYTTLDPFHANDYADRVAGAGHG